MIVSTARQHHLLRPIYAAVVASIVTLLMKSTAYWLTGSAGLFSDAAESLVNMAASVTAMASLWYAARPVDADHTYGHEKIVYFSSGLEGSLVALAGVSTAVLAVERIRNPIRLENLEVGTAIALAASVVNFVVARWLLYVGRKHDSLVLIADGHHLMADVGTSVAVAGGVMLVKHTGIALIDPLCALIVSAVILITGYRLMRDSFNGLMDRALSKSSQEAIRAAIQQELVPNTTFHALRTRRAGHRSFVDFHLLVPGATSVRQAHDHAERISAAIREVIPEAEVTVHTEPIEEPASWQDSELIAIERQSRRAR